MNYILEEDVHIIAREYTKALIEVMQGAAESQIAKELMMTNNLDFPIPIDGISFSGGVSEYIYGMGVPLQVGQAFPVTVKSLVFHKEKEYS